MRTQPQGGLQGDRARGELRASLLCSRIRIRAAEVEAWVDAEPDRASPDQAPYSRPSALRSADGLRRLLAES